MAMQCAANLLQEFAPSATPEQKDDQRGDPDGGRQKSAPSAMPDELAVSSGLSIVMERMLLDDIDKVFRQNFFVKR